MLCAGKSTRFKSNINKIKYIIDNKPLFMYSYDIFSNNRYIDEIIIVQSEDLSNYINNKNTCFVYGGNSRCESVANALKKVTGDIILIHDGARPNITHNMISICLCEIMDNDSVTFGVKSTDTVKIVDSNNYVLSTTDRNNTYLIQTPQCFKKEVIINSYKNIKNNMDLFTDDCSVVENSGYIVKVLDGSTENIKVTKITDIDKIWR